MYQETYLHTCTSLILYFHGKNNYVFLKITVAEIIMYLLNGIYLYYYACTYNIYAAEFQETV